MQKRFLSILFAVAFISLCGVTVEARAKLAPIVHTIKFPAPETHFAEIESVVPTDGRHLVELMMAIWSPGFYRVENYAERVQNFTARTTDGKSLTVEQSQKNRWRIQTDGAAKIIISYRLLCNSRSVTTNWVGEDLAVLNGAATFMTRVGELHRPAEIRLQMPAKWQAMTALESPPANPTNDFRAVDFDALVDSPIVAGNLDIHEFTVAGSQHFVVNAGDRANWNGERGAEDLQKIVRATHRFWGFLPFKRYVFLSIFRQGGGGLEHKDSTLFTSSPKDTLPTLRWLMFVSHEYFHAFNVKRLRPVELGPFDYEKPPTTASLWISEGLTSYYGDLMVARAGLANTQDLLARMSAQIEQLQNSPGRFLQTLEQSSLNVWTNSMSGVNAASNTVSYYVKGNVVGFLLDAKIQRATRGKKSLDDVMRLAFRRFSKARGFTADDFRQTAEAVAGTDLREWFRKTLASTEELDYAEALDWFGLRFVKASGQTTQNWKLEIREDATPAQQSNLKKLCGQ
ncbi:MAG: hypothetical protein AB1757_07795 [Acidobacteriota bacterium]